jgi:hypothetical protein
MVKADSGMKTSLKIDSISILAFMAFSLLLGCEESDPNPSSLSELSSEAKAFLTMRSGTNQSLSAAGNSAINKSFQGAYNNYAQVSGSAGASENKDSTVVEPYPWQSCAEITETKNSDGSITVTTDYGDGCDEGYGDYHYFMHGKYSYTYKYEQSQSGSIFKYVYFYRNIAENYGGMYYSDSDTSEWLSNGHSTYSGESQYDTAKQTFSGFYSYSDTSEYEYDQMTYLYKSEGQTTYDEKKSTTPINSYEYTYGNDYYKSIVLKPLVMDYTCYSMFTEMMVRPFWSTYVSGRERVHYIRDGVEGEFEIDYGNGECDNIIVIYENGKVFKIDLSTDYEALTAKGG